MKYNSPLNYEKPQKFCGFLFLFDPLFTYCRALFKIFHHTKDEIKVFCLLFFKIFSSFLCKVTLRVFAKRFKLMKFGMKVFAQPFSKGWLTKRKNLSII